MIRYDADCVMKNIFEIFDTMNTGRVGQNEILWVFSMAMNGTGFKNIELIKFGFLINFDSFSSAKVAMAIQALRQRW